MIVVGSDFGDIVLDVNETALAVLRHLKVHAPDLKIEGRLGQARLTLPLRQFCFPPPVEDTKDPYGTSLTLVVNDR